ncbi:hypothetical protein GCM10010123_26340 [Pilimelia anulata]|uniref:Uncharacterized protein n=1 Tax=Pilimelia anulata TaxID=53371 RepID=A0A8J3BBE2_9ACTN|nr:hypothetical protein [Pilimelia anulata]GGJ95289.1 hypothetical protein GCM10010123_26340 [Pilimelia anulata]
MGLKWPVIAISGNRWACTYNSEPDFELAVLDKELPDGEVDFFDVTGQRAARDADGGATLVPALGEPGGADLLRERVLAVATAGIREGDLVDVLALFGPLPAAAPAGLGAAGGHRCGFWCKLLRHH